MPNPIAFLPQKWNPPQDPQFNFSGKTIVVTGGNTGLGYEAALKFAQKGAEKVILTSRSLAKGKTAKESIEKLTGKKNVVEVWELEMGSYDSIRAFAQKAQGLKSLDIVVLNAGVMPTEYRKGDYGWETAIQVNVLSTTFLALLLLPKLKTSKTATWTPVIEIVSSSLHRVGAIPDAHANAPMEFFNQPENFTRDSQYATTKLFVQCSVKALSKMTPDVIVTSVCPGPCKSELGREIFPNAVMRAGFTVLAKIFMRTAEEGARTYVSGTVQGEKVNGGFWNDDKLMLDAENISGEKGKKLLEVVWGQTLDALRKDVPEVTQLAKGVSS